MSLGPFLNVLLEEDRLFLAYLTREEALYFLSRACKFLHTLIVNADREHFAPPTASYELCKTLRRIRYHCSVRPNELFILEDFTQMLHTLRQKDSVYLCEKIDFDPTPESEYHCMTILGWHHLHVNNAQMWYNAQIAFEERHRTRRFYSYETTTVLHGMQTLGVVGTGTCRVLADVNDPSSAVKCFLRWTIATTNVDFRELMLARNASCEG